MSTTPWTIRPKLWIWGGSHPVPDEFGSRGNTVVLVVELHSVSAQDNYSFTLALKNKRPFVEALLMEAPKLTTSTAPTSQRLIVMWL